MTEIIALQLVITMCKAEQNQKTTDPDKRKSAGYKCFSQHNGFHLTKKRRN